MLTPSSKLLARVRAARAARRNDRPRARWNRFDDELYTAFAGAEDLPDGSAPFAAELTVDGRHGVAIVSGDPNGGRDPMVCVYVPNGAGEDRDVVYYGTRAPWLLLPEVLAFLERDTTADALAALGFVAGVDGAFPAEAWRP